MKYIEILIAAGDVHSRRGTLESLPLAIQRYIEASHILKLTPPNVPTWGKQKARTFEQLDNEDVQLELGLPLSPKLRKLSETQPRADKLVCHLRTTYFCVTLNPNGQDLSMSEAMATVLNAGQDGPLPRQLFDFLFRQALELCSELRTLGERLLAVIEKKEGERFGALRASHATSVQRQMLDIKRIHLVEAEATTNSLRISGSTQQSQLEFYMNLIGDPLSLLPKTSKDEWTDIH
ncbi:hypothetical protein QBC43DRAFT_348306 [Cladorrhinum sp. PSN259]|nr:hypothetical protein QBC43DRAFT_348306 [Cladorrhinum sp. PSN259]